MTSPGLTGWSNQNDGCQGFSFTGTAIRAASFFGPGIDSLSGALTGVRGVSDTRRRKDIKAQRRFAKVDAPLPFRAPPKRAPRKRAPSASALRGFIARLAKETRARTPKGARRSGGRARALPDGSAGPITRAQLQRQRAKKT